MRFEGFRSRAGHLRERQQHSTPSSIIPFSEQCHWIVRKFYLESIGFAHQLHHVVVDRLTTFKNGHLEVRSRASAKKTQRDSRSHLMRSTISGLSGGGAGRYNFRIVVCVYRTSLKSHTYRRKSWRIVGFAHMAHSRQTTTN